MIDKGKTTKPTITDSREEVTKMTEKIVAGEKSLDIGMVLFKLDGWKFSGH